MLASACLYYSPGPGSCQGGVAGKVLPRWGGGCGIRDMGVGANRPRGLVTAGMRQLYAFQLEMSGKQRAGVFSGQARLWVNRLRGLVDGWHASAVCPPARDVRKTEGVFSGQAWMPTCSRMAVVWVDPLRGDWSGGESRMADRASPWAACLVSLRDPKFPRCGRPT